MMLARGGSAASCNSYNVVYRELAYFLRGRKLDSSPRTDALIAFILPRDNEKRGQLPYFVDVARSLLPLGSLCGIRQQRNDFSNASAEPKSLPSRFLNFHAFLLSSLSSSLFLPSFDQNDFGPI